MLKQRVLTAITALIIVVIALFVLPEWATRLIVSALMLIAAWEWSGLLRAGSALVRLCYVGLIAALMACIVMVLPEAIPAQRVFEVAVAWWVVAFVWLFFHPTAISPAIAWLCGALVIVPAWFSVDWLFQYSNLSLLMVLIIVVAADTGAFFAGKFFGRIKLAPAISPGKTWEGVIGGMVVVTILGTVAALKTGQRLDILLPLFVLVAVFSIVGDLTVSVFKRNAGVKDSGKLFPGHGGVLDRIDSVAAATPAFALAVVLGAVT